MDKLAQELEAARQQVHPAWDEARAERLFAGVGQLRRRRAAARVGMASVGALVAVVALVSIDGGEAGVLPSAEVELVGEQSAAHPGDVVHAGQLRLADGSTASVVGQHSELELLHNQPLHIAMRMHKGQAHFDVVPNAERSFVVESGPFRVVVIGTVFDVARQGDALVVGVSRGKVRVYGPAGAHDVAAGEQQSFPLDGASAAEAAQVEANGNADADADEVAGLEAELEEGVETAEHGAVEGRAGRAVKARSVRPKRGKGWRSLSQSGDYEAAFASLRAGGVVEDEPSALMDAADAARLSGHPQAAVKYLERVVRDHGRSPVAPLAAFTLGRVYLDRLGLPHKAAQAFGEARALSPTGSLAQDALAREVEALSKGGDAQAAYRKAQQYMQRYPNGRRLRAVQLYGGLE